MPSQVLFDAVRFMAPPFVACVLLVGIHGYLGVHVIMRQVIFVDLALAQIAALGAMIVLVFGYATDSNTAYIASLGFTFLGAAIFALTRMKEQRVPQEAIIGVVFAVATALAMMVAAKSSAHGAEHIHTMLAGRILWVKWETVAKTAAIYAGIGVFHVLWLKKFMAISEDPARAIEKGMWVRLWDFLFYLSFGLVITSSVRIAGVLLVFAFLIIPAATAVLFAKRLWVRVMIGWALGTLVSFAAMICSYRNDFPTGPTVVSFLGGALVAAAVIRYVLTVCSKTGRLARLVRPENLIHSPDRPCRSGGPTDEVRAETSHDARE